MRKPACLLSNEPITLLHEKVPRTFFESLLIPMDDTLDGCATAMIWLVTLVIAIIIGFTTWYWLQPESAFEYFCFLIGWIFFSITGHLVSRFIVQLINKIT